MPIIHNGDKRILIGLKQLESTRSAQCTTKPYIDIQCVSYSIRQFRYLRSSDTLILFSQQDLGTSPGQTTVTIYRYKTLICLWWNWALLWKLTLFIREIERVKTELSIPKPSRENNKTIERWIHNSLYSNIYIYTLLDNHFTFEGYASHRTFYTASTFFRVVINKSTRQYPAVSYALTTLCEHTPVARYHRN